MNRLTRQIPLALVLVAVTLVTTSCGDTYEDLFTNPEKSTEAKIEYLFTKDLQNSSFNIDYWETYYMTFPNIGAWTQGQGITNDEGMMDIAQQKWGTEVWNSYYAGTLMLYKEMQTIYEGLPAEQKASYDVYLNLGKILNAYNMAKVTDLWGDVPYSEAGTARNPTQQNLYPKLDTQEEIYDALLKDLKDASDALRGGNLTANASLATQDYFLKGDLLKWQKFANAVRLRLALQLSEVNASKSQALVAEILNGSYPLPESNAENIIFPFTSTNTSFNNIGNTFRDSNHWAYAPKFMLDMMKEANDPRLPVYFDPNYAGEYVGLPSSPDLQGNVDRNTYARLDSLLFEQNYNLPFWVVTAAEVDFMKAEAAQRGWYSGNAEQLYNKAVTESVEMWYDAYNSASSTTDLPAPTSDELASFLNSGSVKYNGTLERIMTQKWMHYLIMFPYQQWADYRRTDYPVLPADTFNGRVLDKPTRITYPPSETVNNQPTYGPVKDKDKPTARVWWDVD